MTSLRKTRQVKFPLETQRRYKEAKKMRIKRLTRESTLKNINGLSVGDRAYCGPYGTITCTKKAVWVGESVVRGSRRFKVTNSTKVRNGGNYSMKALRKAIAA